jgi:hypothetical protein
VTEAMLAAAGGDQSVASALEAAFDKASAKQVALIAVLRRIIAGERGETLLDGLDELDTAVARHYGRTWAAEGTADVD